MFKISNYMVDIDRNVRYFDWNVRDYDLILESLFVIFMIWPLTEIC